jgi:hypothetical protein
MFASKFLYLFGSSSICRATNGKLIFNCRSSPKQYTTRSKQTIACFTKNWFINWSRRVQLSCLHKTQASTVGDLPVTKTLRWHIICPLARTCTARLSTVAIYQILGFTTKTILWRWSRPGWITSTLYSAKLEVKTQTIHGSNNNLCKSG